MFHRAVKSHIILAILVFMSACSSGSPVAPVETDNIACRAQVIPASRYIWSLYDVSLDPVSGSVECIPDRTGSFNANVVRFLQPPASPVQMLSVTVLPGSLPQDGYWEFEITLRHPFVGSAKYRGFDVRGILLAEGYQSGIHDSGILYNLTGGTRLLNADGYTRWWNFPEFTSYETIFGYTNGTRSTPGFEPDATLNPYKLFSDDLEEYEPVSDLDPAMRAGFGIMPGVNSRVYKIQFDLTGGSPPIRFKYAIDASWSNPDPAYDPDYPVEAYDQLANCQEPYLIDILDFEAIPSYPPLSTGGDDTTLIITIGDWQAETGGDVINELSHLWIESPTMLNEPVDVLPDVEYIGSPQQTQGTYRVTVPDCVPTSVVDQYFLITAESYSPSTYAPQIDGDPSLFIWPDATLAAYQVTEVPVNEQIVGPLDDPFVIGIPDLYPFYHNVYGDNLVFFDNLINLENEGSYNDGNTVIWWEGHLDPAPLYFVPLFITVVQNNGYTFLQTSDYDVDLSDCRLLIVSYAAYDAICQTDSIDQEKVNELRHFALNGGILCFLIEKPLACNEEKFDELMMDLGVDLRYGSYGNDDGTHYNSLDVSPHPLTVGVDVFSFYSYGDFDLLDDDCESIVRDLDGHHIVVTAPIS